MKLGNTLLAQSGEQGALPSLAAATLDLPGGSYLGPSGWNEMRGAPTLVGRTPSASDPELARRLWEASAELTGVDFPAPADLGERWRRPPSARKTLRREVYQAEMVEVISSCH